MKNLIAQLLNEKEISIRELSKRTGKPYAHIHEIVRAETIGGRSLEVLVEISKAIGCEVTDLFEEDKKVKQYAIITSKGIDIWVDRFETKKEAIETAEWEWNTRLTKSDKFGRAVHVGKLASPNDEDDCELNEVYASYGK